METKISLPSNLNRVGRRVRKYTSVRDLSFPFDFRGELRYKQGMNLAVPESRGRADHQPSRVNKLKTMLTATLMFALISCGTNKVVNSEHEKLPDDETLRTETLSSMLKNLASDDPHIYIMSDGAINNFESQISTVEKYLRTAHSSEYEYYRKIAIRKSFECLMHLINGDEIGEYVLTEYDVLKDNFFYDLKKILANVGVEVNYEIPLGIEPTIIANPADTDLSENGITPDRLYPQVGDVLKIANHIPYVEDDGLVTHKIQLAIYRPGEAKIGIIERNGVLYEETTVPKKPIGYSVFLEGITEQQMLLINTYKQKMNMLRSNQLTSKYRSL